MAVDVNKITYGAGVLSLGAWVTAGGAGTLTDVGATVDGVEIQLDGAEDLEIEIDQAITPVKAVAMKAVKSLTCTIAEMGLPLLQQLLRQVAGNLTGADPNRSLIIDLPQSGDAYMLQATFVTRGIQGATGVYASRTYTFWKCKPKIEAIPHKKNEIQKYKLTLAIWQDTSIAPATAGKGQFGKVVDTGAA